MTLEELVKEGKVYEYFWEKDSTSCSWCPQDTFQRHLTPCLFWNTYIKKYNLLWICASHFQLEKSKLIELTEDDVTFNKIHGAKERFKRDLSYLINNANIAGIDESEIIKEVHKAYRDNIIKEIIE